MHKNWLRCLSMVRWGGHHFVLLCVFSLACVNVYAPLLGYAVPLAGYVVGGLGYGESLDARHAILSAVLVRCLSGACGRYMFWLCGSPMMMTHLDRIVQPLLPAQRARMLPGCANPAEVLAAVALGIDLFDSSYVVCARVRVRARARALVVDAASFFFFSVWFFPSSLICQVSLFSFLGLSVFVCSKKQECVPMIIFIL
jgi:hypothetical protein